MKTIDFLRMEIPLGLITRWATGFVSCFLLGSGNKSRLLLEGCGLRRYSNRHLSWADRLRKLAETSFCLASQCGPFLYVQT